MESIGLREENMIRDDQHFSKKDLKNRMQDEMEQDESEIEEKDDFTDESEDDYEDESDMKSQSGWNEKIDTVRAFCNNHKKPVIIASIIILCIIIGSIVAVVAHSHSDSASNGITATEKTTTSVENESVSVVAAEVGEADDPGDSQQKAANNAEGNGVAVDVASLKNAKSDSTSNGIDVSKWQGKIDWNAVAATGIDFVMVRVGYRTEPTGVITEDLYARYNMQKAAEAGIKVGAYFFSTATTKEEALEEAAWTTNFISKYAITYPVAYNCEGYTASDSRMSGMSNADRTDNAVAFLNYVQNAGYEPMFYAGKGELENSTYWDSDRISANYKVWVAQYPSVAYPATESSSYTGAHVMWQYTNQGSVSGISGGIDINVAYFNYASVATPKDTSGAANADNPELGITFTATSGQITAKDETNLRSLPSTAGDIIATLKNGEYATLVATGSNGWSKLQYNGKTVYALSRLLTTEVNATQATTQAATKADPFTAASGQVTAKDEVNLRSAPNTGGTVVATIKNGTFCTRTGTNATTGWTRLDYNGQTVYAVTSYLTDTAKTPATETTTAATSGTKLVFTIVNEQVTAKETVNLRSLPSVDAGLVYELKNGEYVTRTGTNATYGWSRLEYNGQVVYAVSQYLITK